MIEIKITADTAVALAQQLRTFVDTFVSLAKDSEPGFDTTTETKTAEPPKAAAATDAPKTRKPRAQTVEGKASAPVGAADDLDDLGGVTPDQVRALLNKLRAEKGNDALGKVVTQFAPKFSEIPESSYAQLYAVAKKHLETA